MMMMMMMMKKKKNKKNNIKLKFTRGMSHLGADALRVAPRRLAIAA